MPRWDIFCQIIDHFGDIGFCWRLARQLTEEHGIAIRLIVDDMQTASRIIPGLQAQLPTQFVAGVRVDHWHTEFQRADLADVVIEAFACTPPASYQQHMPDKKPVWVSLEYLSAELWVDDFHRQSAMHPQLGLRRHMFFPGFSPASGGLLREQGLLAQHQHWTHAIENTPDCSRTFWQSLLQPHQQLNIDLDALQQSLKVSLFCYTHAPVGKLLQAMCSSEQAVTCFIPQGVASEQLRPWLGTTPEAGCSARHGALTLHCIPFLSQATYDQLLTSCDLNFVRGEDSWIRALWAGKPFIWQPYRQSEATHLQKLRAFLDVYAADMPTIQQAHLAWVGEDTDLLAPVATGLAAGGWSQALWDSVCWQLADWHEHALQQRKQLAEQPDLAQQLRQFCQNLLAR